MTTLGWVRAGYGLALLALPGHTTGLVVGQPLTLGPRNIVRVLGSRDIAQALACSPRPTSEVSKFGAVVDGLHASSMLLLAVASSKWRRPALASAAVASTFAVLSVREERALPRAFRDSDAPISKMPQSMVEQLLDVRDLFARKALQMLDPSNSNRSHSDGPR